MTCLPVHQNTEKLFPPGKIISVKSYRLISALIIIMLLPVSISYAGNNKVAAVPPVTITGRVMDQSGKPLEGVTVQVKATSTTTLTDASGNYTINVAQVGDVLIFSYVGYLTQEVKSERQLSVYLKLIDSSLNEIVVIAYGTQKRKDVTGAISSIKNDAIKDIPVISVEQLLKGQVAGVQASVTSGTPGAASNINIRGVSSISASTQPLYVVDGMPFQGGDIQTGFAEARTAMDFINPEDIESIEILKDAAATSIYGARGANGVILITTKSGKAGNSAVTFSASTGLTTMAHKIQMMTTRQAQEYWAVAQAREGKNDNALDPSRLDINTDWQDVTTQNALMQKYNLGFQGGQQKLQYYLSFDYLDQEGLLKYTRYNRYSMRANLSAQISNKLQVSNKFSIAQSKNDGSFTNGQGVTANGTGAIHRIIQAPTFRKVNSKDPGVDPETGDTYIDPLVILRDLNDDIKVTNITEQITVKYNIFKGLDFQAMGGATYRFLKNDQYQGEGFVATLGDKRLTAQVNNSYRVNYINENTLTYNKKTGLHNFTVLLGNTVQQETADGTTINARDFPNAKSGTNALQNAKEVTVSSFKQQWQLASFFGRLNYSLNNKYLLTATLRRDGSSKLAKGNKWGTFPSVALGWNISDEPFLKNVHAISNLKLRASWGQIGNSEIGTYQTLTLINSGTGPFDNQQLPYYTVGSYGDPNLKWEISEQTNIGLDIDLLKGRLSVTADVFDKKTKDLLLAQPISFSAGYGSYLTNVGSMRNRGAELTVNYQVLRKKKLQWTANVNATFLNNKVTDVGNEGLVPVGLTVDGEAPRYLAIGQSIGTFYLVKTAGVWQLGEETEAAKYGAVPGNWKFIDQNNDGRIDNDDRTFVGNAMPDISLGFSNTFKYKNFDCQVLLAADLGSQTLNAIKPTLWQARQAGAAAYDLEAWSPTNPTNKLAAPDLNYNNNLDFLHDGYLEKADILRIQNVRIGYRLHPKIRKKTSFYVYLSGNNVWSWSGYDGYDPEVGNGINRGIDRFSYPRGRIYNAGVQLSF